MNKKLLPAMFGSFVEFYDFSIYSYTAIIIAPLFFPSEDPVLSIIMAYAVFAVGNLSRPLGAILFGAIGDKYGRKTTLEITIVGIAIPTIIIGLLPTFQTLSYWAPVILLLCRLLQGVFVGGEADGVAIYIQESIKPGLECFANSLNRTTSSSGILLGAAIVWLCNLEDLPNWCWRIPFLIGGVMGLATLALRRNMNETKEFTNMKHTFKSKSQSFLDVISENWKKILVVIFVCGAHGGLYNFFYVFWFNYLGDMLHITSHDIAEFWKMIAILVYVCFSPLTGILADRFGLEKILGLAILLSLPIIGVSFFLLDNNTMSLLWVTITSMWITLILAPGYVLLMKLFDPSVRYRCMGIGHTIGSALFSGTSPIMATYVWHSSGSIVSAPLYYSVALIGLMSIGLFFIVKYSLRKTKSSHQQLNFSGNIGALVEA